MQLMRIGAAGRERPVVRVSEYAYVDVSDVTRDFDEDFFGGDGIAEVRAIVEQRSSSGQVVRFQGQRVGAPIARPHQIVCVGLNYADHAAETGAQPPGEPILFNKAPNTLVGPNDDLIVPRGATKVDWEVELGIVVGRRALYLDTDAAAAASIAGYVLVNDVSERDFQLDRGGQWVKGKSSPTFNPAGPWLTTSDEMPDVSALDMWLDVNGRRRQTGSTSTMIFDPLHIVKYVSQFMALEPGDLINTGTPPGVALGQLHPTWLAPGDVVELGITALGRQRQIVVPYEQEGEQQR